jgi:hypothetical protein
MMYCLNKQEIKLPIIRVFLTDINKMSKKELLTQVRRVSLLKYYGERVGLGIGLSYGWTGLLPLKPVQDKEVEICSEDKKRAAGRQVPVHRPRSGTEELI